MNQEQNNLNQNNFNSQGHNNFSNNQFNQTPMNNKPPKKFNIGLIAGAVIGIAAIGIGSFMLINNNSTNNQNNEANNNSVSDVNDIKKGTAKLVYTSKNKIHKIENVNAYNYFETKDENGKTVILDNKGNELFKAFSFEYLGDSYFLVFRDENNNDDYRKVYDANKRQYIFQFNCKGDYTKFSNRYIYKNGILYYYDINDKTIAYDLNNQKQLWSVNAYGSLMRITNEYIFFDSTNYSSISDINKNEFYPSIVTDLDGNVVIEGNTDKIEYSYGLDKYDLVHTFVMNDKYYLKVKFKKYIEVYDFNHKLISNISLEPTDTTNYYLHRVFDEGVFSVWESNKEGSSKYVLYDINKNRLLESDSNIDYAGNVNGSIISSDVLALRSADKYYLVKDSKIVEKFDDYHNEDDSLLITPPIGDENSFLLIENNDTVNSVYNKQYINLKTLEKFDIPSKDLEQYDLEHFSEAPNGEYIIIGHYVYDSKFNLKYQGKLLEPINDKYVFEYTLKENDKVSIVNIETGKKNEIEIKGKYQYELSAGGFVTSDGTNYYLYGFN